jgi:5-methylcytosine-specific restriction enzyme A
VRRNLLPVLCAEGGCPERTWYGSRCPAHTRSRWPDSGDTYRGGWRKLRDAYIREHPTCQWPGCGAQADEVDHVVPVRVDPSRRLDASNLRSLCLHHHRSITARASNGKGSENSGSTLRDSSPSATRAAAFPGILYPERPGTLGSGGIGA